MSVTPLLRYLNTLSCKTHMPSGIRLLAEYVQLKPILAVITVILKATGTYAEGQFEANAGYTYVSITYNFSVSLALYCLAMFWVCTNSDLQPFRPMPKFLCVKSLVFATFWQGLVVSILVRTGFLHSCEKLHLENDCACSY